MAEAAVRGVLRGFFEVVEHFFRPHEPVLTWGGADRRFRQRVDRFRLVAGCVI
jgi:hypothetical protein